MLVNQSSKILNENIKLNSYYSACKGENVMSIGQEMTSVEFFDTTLCDKVCQWLDNNVVSSTPRHEQGSNSQLTTQVVVNPTIILSRPRRPLTVRWWKWNNILEVDTHNTQSINSLHVI